MTKKKQGSSLTNPRKSTLSQRTILRVEDHDTTIKTRAFLIARGYIKPGDSQYDAKLDPAAAARKAKRAADRAEALEQLADVNRRIVEEEKVIQTIEIRMLEEAPVELTSVAS